MNIKKSLKFVITKLLTEPKFSANKIVDKKKLFDNMTKQISEGPVPLFSGKYGNLDTYKIYFFQPNRKEKQWACTCTSLAAGC